MAGISSSTTSIAPGGAQDVGFKLAKETFDVFTAAKKDLIITSGSNSIKIANALSGSKTTSGSGEQTHNIPHGLSYLPGFMPFLKVAGRWYGSVGQDLTNDLSWRFTTDTTNIILLTSDFTGFTVSYKIFNFVDPATNIGVTNVPGQDVGTKISQDGWDVFTAKEQYLTYLSSRDTFRIVKIITIQVNVADRPEVVVAHGLPFTPAWIGLIKSTVSFDGLLGKIVTAPYFLTGNREVHVWSDATNIGVRVESLGAENYTVKIAVLANKLE